MLRYRGACRTCRLFHLDAHCLNDKLYCVGREITEVNYMHAKRKTEAANQSSDRHLTKKALVLLKPDWSTAWRGIARLTYGITDEDPRFSQIMKTLNTCDEAYLANDWIKFQRGAGLLRRILGK